MPEISRFYGIVIKIYFDDHHPAHFHAEYGDREAVVSIGTPRGDRRPTSPTGIGLVMEWASQHHDELVDAWTRAKNLEAPGKIAPLP